MRNIKLTIEYDGKRYLGWQRLGDSDRTIQEKIESILTQMTNEKIEIIGSGRTDAGTHARGQVANFKTASDLSPEKMLQFLNRYLPQDIGSMPVTMRPANNTVIMFGIVRFQPYLNVIGVFIVRKSLIGTKCKQLVRSLLALMILLAFLH